jgi:hypothetical protein
MKYLGWTILLIVVIGHLFGICRIGIPSAITDTAFIISGTTLICVDRIKPFPSPQKEGNNGDNDSNASGCKVETKGLS